MKTTTTPCYKLTSQSLTTHGGFLWTPKKWTKKLSGEGELCSGNWYHAYRHPLLALFLNPIHANLSDPILWKAEGKGVMKDDRGLKCGFQSMRLAEQVNFVMPTTEQQVCFAMLCAKDVYKEASFVEFADKYLKGEDRSARAADAADAAYAAYAARAAAYAADAAYAAYAAYAARAAAYAADAAYAAYAARAADAAYAAYAARAARAAAYAADAADFLPKLILAAETAMKLK